MAILFILRVFCQKSAARKSPKKTFCILFWCLVWGSNPGFKSNKPTRLRVVIFKLNKYLQWVYLMLNFWKRKQRHLWNPFYQHQKNIFNFISAYFAFWKKEKQNISFIARFQRLLFYLFSRVWNTFLKWYLNTKIYFVFYVPHLHKLCRLVLYKKSQQQKQF